jgi:hypothetical protein
MMRLLNRFKLIQYIHSTFSSPSSFKRQYIYLEFPLEWSKQAAGEE